MTEAAKHRPDIINQSAEQRVARERMALFPSGEGVEVIYVHKDLWVVSPLACVFEHVEYGFSLMDCFFCGCGIWYVVCGVVDSRLSG